MDPAFELKCWAQNIFIYPLSLTGVAQSCLTLCDPMDCSLPGSSVHGIFQARILGWVAISFSRLSSQPRELRSPALQENSLLTELPGNSKMEDYWVIYIVTIRHWLRAVPWGTFILWQVGPTSWAANLVQQQEKCGCWQLENCRWGWCSLSVKQVSHQQLPLQSTVRNAPDAFLT